MLAYPNFPQFSYLRLLEPRPSGYQTPPNPPKLLDQVRTVLRRQHYSIRTEETYTQWISRFIRFHKMRHPQEMDTPEIEAFLTTWPSMNGSPLLPKIRLLVPSSSYTRTSSINPPLPQLTPCAPKPPSACPPFSAKQKPKPYSTP